MRGASATAMLAGFCLCATPSFGQIATSPPGATPLTGVAVTPVAAILRRASPIAGTILLERDTMIRLMVVNEVSTKTAHPGDRFVLRVDEDVKVGDTKLIPIGASAWGEVTTAEESGAAGKAGKLGARLLYVDLPSMHLPIRGDRADKGPGGAEATVFAVLGLGILGLLARGTNAKLKAGDIFNAYVAEDMIFDPANGGFRALPPVPLTLATAPAR